MKATAFQEKRLLDGSVSEHNELYRGYLGQVGSQLRAPAQRNTNTIKART